MTSDAPLSVTFPDDHDATARILGTDPLASQIAERYANRLVERPDDLAAAVQGRTVTATPAELGLIDDRPDDSVTLELDFTYGGPDE